MPRAKTTPVPALPLLSERQAILLAALAALSIWGVLLAVFPVTDDAYHAAFRGIEMQYCAANGQPLAEWAPHLYAGRGSPLFEFYGPLASWVVALIQTILKTGSALTTGLATLFFVLVGSVGVYRYSRRSHEPAASAFAALAFALSPYLVTDAFVRGALAEMAGIAFLPWILYGIDAVAQNAAAKTNSSRATALLALPVAFLIFSHPPTALLGGAFVVAYAAFVASKQPVAQKPGVIRGVFGGFLLGFGLAAAYALPALLQTGFVRIQDLRLDAFANLFLNPVALLLSPLVSFGPSRVAFGLLAFLLVLAGASYKEKNKNFKLNSDSRTKFFFWAVIAGLVLCTSASLIAWNVVSAAQIVQFPWRVLAVTIVFASLLAAPAFERFAKAAQGKLPSERAVFSVLAILLVLNAFAWVQGIRSYSKDPAFTTQTLLSSDISATYRNEYAPAGFKVGPPRFSAPLQGTNSLLPPIIIDGFGQSCTEQKILFTNPGLADQTIEVRLFAFPFWSVFLDGKPQLFSATQDGLVQVANVPPGSHTLVISREPTPLEHASRALSMVSVLLFLLFCMGNRPALIGRKEKR